MPSGEARDPHFLWRNAQRAAGFCTAKIHESDFICRTIKFGVFEKPIKAPPLETKFSLPQIPVDPENAEWLREELKDVIRRRVYEEIPMEEALHMRHTHNYPISIALIVTDPKLPLVVNLHRQSSLFRPQPVTMENLKYFTLELNKDDHLVSCDIQKSYHHFRLHPQIRNWFIFRLDGSYFRCIDLPFGWSLSPPYLIKFICPFVRYIGHNIGLQIHPYMEDFMVAVSNKEKLRKVQ